MNSTTTHFDGNLDLSALRKKRFTIDNDENRVLELDTSDLSILTRLSEYYPKLNELGQRASTLADDEPINDDELDTSVASLASKLSALDVEMRSIVDAIFNANVCAVCAPSGTMYDPIGGTIRADYIISALTQLYGAELTKEFKRIQKRVDSHTRKYTK